MKAYDLGISSRWVVSFTPRPLYPLGKSPRNPLNRRFGGPQSRSGRRGEEKILWFQLKIMTINNVHKSGHCFDLLDIMSINKKRNTVCLNDLWGLSASPNDADRDVMIRKLIPSTGINITILETSLRTEDISFIRLFTKCMAYKIVHMLRSRDSSVGIAISYGVRFPAAVSNLSLLHSLQTGSRFHPASYWMDIWDSFSGGKVAGAWSWPLTSI
jgi:hypothetical protein